VSLRLNSVAWFPEGKFGHCVRKQSVNAFIVIL